MSSKLTPISWKTLAKIAEKLGFEHKRTRGDHMAYIKPGIKRPLMIPKYSPINDPRIVKSFIKTAEITQAEFLKLKTECK